MGSNIEKIDKKVATSVKGSLEEVIKNETRTTENIDGNVGKFLQRGSLLNRENKQGTTEYTELKVDRIKTIN